MGSHLRLVIYSSQGDIHTPAHCSARPSFLCTTAHTHPGATWQTSGLGSNISRQVFPTFYTYATHYFSLSFLYATTTSWKTTEWKREGNRLGVESWPLTSPLKPQFLTGNVQEMETVTNFILGGSKITADGDCSHEIKRLAPWKKSYDQQTAY